MAFSEYLETLTEEQYNKIKTQAEDTEYAKVVQGDCDDLIENLTRQLLHAQSDADVLRFSRQLQGVELLRQIIKSQVPIIQHDEEEEE